MTRRIPILAKIGSIIVLICASALAQSPPPQSEIVQRDGMIYHETRRSLRKPIVDEQWQEHAETVRRVRYTTDFVDTDELVQVPSTTYVWKPRWRGFLNPFSSPRLEYEYVPVVRWQTERRSRKVPVTREAWGTEQRTVRVPVRSLRFSEQEQVTRVALGPATSDWALPPTTDQGWTARIDSADDLRR